MRGQAPLFGQGLCKSFQKIKKYFIAKFPNQNSPERHFNSPPPQYCLNFRAFPKKTAGSFEIYSDTILRVLSFFLGYSDDPSCLAKVFPKCSGYVVTWGVTGVTWGGRWHTRWVKGFREAGSSARNRSRYVAVQNVTRVWAVSWTSPSSSRYPTASPTGRRRNGGDSNLKKLKKF